MSRSKYRPTLPGPQPWNAGLAGTFEAQLSRAKMPRPRRRPSDLARLSDLDRLGGRFGELVREIYDRLSWLEGRA